MFGVLNLYKPPGVTSRHSVNVIQRLVRPAKVGHAGTLDPMATGVLLVCVGPATRLISLLQQSPKTYRAEFRLGERSDTDDSTGDVQITPDQCPVSAGDVEQALQHFVGEIDQIPPAYSAVKVSGRRAYKLARDGEEVVLRSKQVVVHDIQLLSYQWPVLELEIQCGSGTYIRSIARDLGNRLGCGGLMSHLERTCIGSFSARDAVQPESLTPENLSDHLHSPISLLEDIPQYACSPDDVTRLQNGRQIPLTSTKHFVGHTAAREQIALTSPDAKDLLALGKLTADGTAIQPKMVFINR